MSRVEARKLANELRQELLPVGTRSFDLEELLEDMDIRVIRERPAAGTAEAMSFDLGDVDVILAEPSVSRRRFRFSVAHELGHLLLGHGSAPCSTYAIHGSSQDPQEQEANTFAAELLMPSRQFRADIKPVHPRIEEISQIADDYDTSLTATVLRYVTETNDYCAVVGVREDEGYWFEKSDRARWFLELPPVEGTLAHARMTDGCADESWAVPAELWLKDFSWSEGWEITEDVVPVAPGEWLVLLSELPDPDDDPDLVEREAEEDLERRRMSFPRY